MKFRKTEQDLVDSASREAVAAAWSDLKPHVAVERWLATRNPFEGDAAEHFNQAWSQGEVDTRYAAEYVAASAPLHCLDGWNFLSRALGASLRGDPDVARHLGYYAELRAAMSILATEGIGILSGRHIVVTNEGVVSALPRRRTDSFPTHEAVWAILEYWAGRPVAGDLLSKVIRPFSVPMDEWIKALPSAGTWLPLGRAWMRTWGLDLRRMSDDRAARNEASYRPNRLVPRTTLKPSECIDFANAFWKLCEPMPSSPFEWIDRFLLRESLDRLTLQAKTDIAAQIDVLLNSTLTGSDLEDTARRFLLRHEAETTPQIFEHAQRREGAASPQHHLQVLSRAGLLLRVATGSTRLLIQNASPSYEDLEFWWQNLGEQFGLWKDAERPDPLTDLWVDVSDSFADMESWIEADPEKTWSDVRLQHSVVISGLEGCQRIPIWALSA